MDWWAHQVVIYLMCTNSLQKDTGSMEYKVANYLVNLQTSKSIPTKGTQDNLGHMQPNKYRTPPCKLYSHSSRGTKVDMTKVSGFSRGNFDVQLPKDPDDQPPACVHSPLYNPNPLHMQNDRDITK